MSVAPGKVHRRTPSHCCVSGNAEAQGKSLDPILHTDSSHSTHILIIFHSHDTHLLLTSCPHRDHLSVRAALARRPRLANSRCRPSVLGNDVLGPGGLQVDDNLAICSRIEAFYSDEVKWTE